MLISKLLSNPTPVIGNSYGSKASVDDSVMAIAVLWAQLRSKDPRTKCGCAIYDQDTGGMVLGYNGFPRGIPDSQALWDCRDRDAEHNKYAYVRHAEENALDKAREMRLNPRTSTLYVTHYPCSVCAKAIVQFGLRTVRYIHEYPDSTSPTIFMLAGVDIARMTFDLEFA